MGGGEGRDERTLSAAPLARRSRLGNSDDAGQAAWEVMEWALPLLSGNFAETVA